MNNKGSKKLYIFVLIILLLVFGQSIYGISRIVVLSLKDTNEYVYNIESKTDYRVYIKENDFINERVLPAGKSYITELVDKIHFKLEYEYSSLDFIEVNSKHAVIITLYGQYSKDTANAKNPIIWEKEYVLKDQENVTLTESNNKIIEEFDIDLLKYVDEITSFKETFSITTIAFMEVSMPVIINGSNADYIVGDTHDIVATIELGEKVFDINSKPEDLETKMIQSINESPIEVDSRKLSIYLLLLLSSLTMVLLTIKKLGTYRKKEKFDNYLKKLKRDYNEIIVETKNMVNVKNLKPIAITTFDELLNLSNSLEMPIILYEKDEVACFYIVKDKIIYTFLIKNKVKE